MNLRSTIFASEIALKNVVMPENLNRSTCMRCDVITSAHCTVGKWPLIKKRRKIYLTTWGEVQNSWNCADISHLLLLCNSSCHTNEKWEDQTLVGHKIKMAEKNDQICPLFRLFWWNGSMFFNVENSGKQIQDGLSQPCYIFCNLPIKNAPGLRNKGK